MPSENVFDEYSAGTLRSGSKHGPKVKSRKQAIAIYLSERRKEGKPIHKKNLRKARSGKRY